MVDPAQHTLLGGFQYRESLPLNDKEVVITFDDGPLPPYCARILDILARECVKATYFMVGKMARAFPKLVRRTYDEGHTLANHSQSHPFNFHTMSVLDARARSTAASTRSGPRSAIRPRSRRSSGSPACSARTRSSAISRRNRS